MEFDPETDLRLERELKAPRQLLWRCWTTPELVKRFFVPKPHQVLDCKIDLRPGGRFDTTFEVEGNRMENSGVWLEVVPEERLVFTDAYSAGWKPAPEPFMTAIIAFRDAPGGGTLYTATVRHRTPEARQSHEDMGFFDGWGTVATQMEAYAQSIK